MFLLPDQKPDVMYADIGGMDIQKQEVREAVELPLTHFELYKQVSIQQKCDISAWTLTNIYRLHGKSEGKYHGFAQSKCSTPVLDC